MQHYVLGFMFNADYSKLALIRKNRPAWQAGRLNGIGGKIEPGELPLAAMIREFEEETGYRHDDWAEYATLDCPGAVIHVFAATAECHDSLDSVTDEPIVVIDPALLPSESIYNLRWLVPMAADSAIQRPQRISCS